MQQYGTDHVFYNAVWQDTPQVRAIKVFFSRRRRAENVVCPVLYSFQSDHSYRTKEDRVAVAPTCIFHEGGRVSQVFAKRIDLTGKLLGIVAQAQFVPIHFQQKSAVTG